MVQVIFRESANAPVGAKFLSLFPGLGYAAGYKILQRVYKFVFLSPFSLSLIVSPLSAPWEEDDTDTFTFNRFGGQPYFNDFLNNNYKTRFTNAFGEKNGKAMMQATAGS